MKPEILIILQTLVTTAATIAYIFTYRYLSTKVKSMDQTVSTMKSLIDSQTQLLQNVDSYKKLYDPKDFEQAMLLKLDNQKLTLRKDFEKQKDEIVDSIKKNMSGRFVEANADLLKMVEELIQFPVHMAIKQFPDKSQKAEKDVFLKQNYPYTAAKIIAFTDDILDEQVKSESQTKK